MSSSSLYLHGMRILEEKLNKGCFNWDDFFTKHDNLNNYSLFSICYTQILTAILYMFLKYYLSNVFPGSSGTPKPFYYLLTKSYWKSRFTFESSASKVSKEYNTKNNEIKVINLTKVYRKFIWSPKLYAARDVCFNLPKNTITILLGHNGAGKTTTMSMITGIEKPSSGKIIVGGEEDVKIYRTKIGYCPQHDKHFIYLNVREHLYFYGRLREVSKNEIDDQINSLIYKCHLVKHADDSILLLSRGLKRYLSLAISVIGHTTFVILDEPSSGLDSVSRRYLWDILLPMRKERTILLTTHSMEEADVLGDQIIIMDNGIVVCQGTQLHLKRKYGNGYTLTVIGNPGFNINNCFKLIKNIIDTAYIKENTKSMVKFVLPYEEIHYYGICLEELECQRKQLKIKRFGLTNSEMEEVFFNSSTTAKADIGNDIKPVASTVTDRKEPKIQIFFLFYGNQFLAILYIYIPILSLLLLHYIRNIHKWQLEDLMAKSTYYNVDGYLIETPSSRVSYNDNNITVELLQWDHRVLTKTTNEIYKVLTAKRHTIEQKVNSDIPFYMIIYKLYYPGFMAIGMIAYLIFFINLPYIENEIEFKAIQTIPPSLLWISTYLFDCVLHSGLSVVYSYVTHILDKDKQISDVKILYILMILLIFGYTMLPMFYLLVRTGIKLPTIYTIIFYSSIGVALILFVFEKGFYKVSNYNQPWHFVARLVPDTIIRFLIKFTLKEKDTEEIKWKILQFIPISIFYIIVLLAALIFVFEDEIKKSRLKNFYHFLTKGYYFHPEKRNVDIRRKTIINTRVDPDSFVLKETEYVGTIIKNKSLDNYCQIVSSVTKQYKDKQVLSTITYAISHGDCLGLLGLNSSGKTTLFNIITLNTALSSGNMYINGYHYQDQTDYYIRQYGYCPETDVLLKKFTAFELLKYTTWIKGTPISKLNQEVNFWLKGMNIERYKNNEIHTYSGGTKRKLLIAMAMTSNPSIVFLDEPTTGIDPVSRQFMWKCIKDFQNSFKTVVLSTHSMDECEQLCNRLALISGGQLQYVGLLEDFKTITPSGFSLIIKLKDNITDENKNIVKKLVKTVYDEYEMVLRDEYSSSLIYNVLARKLKWSVIFMKSQTIKENLKEFIEDIAISESSLKDIVLQLRKEPSID